MLKLKDMEKLMQEYENKFVAIQNEMVKKTDLLSKKEKMCE